MGVAMLAAVPALFALAALVKDGGGAEGFLLFVAFLFLPAGALMLIEGDRLPAAHWRPELPVRLEKGALVLGERTIARNAIRRALVVSTEDGNALRLELRRAPAVTLRFHPERDAHSALEVIEFGPDRHVVDFVLPPPWNPFVWLTLALVLGCLLWPLPWALGVGAAAVAVAVAGAISSRVMPWARLRVGADGVWIRQGWKSRFVPAAQIERAEAIDPKRPWRRDGSRTTRLSLPPKRSRSFFAMA